MSNSKPFNERDFWAYVTSLGLLPEQVLDSLGVASLKDSPLIANKKALAEKVHSLAPVPMSVTPQGANPAYPLAIAWANVYTPDDVKLNLTARHGATEDDLISIYQVWVGAWAKIKQMGGRKSPGPSRPNRKAAKPAPATPAKKATTPQVPLAQVEKKSEPVQPASPPGSDDKEVWLTIEHLQKNSNNGKISYRAFGPPKFRRYGVMVWPEVAEVMGQFGLSLEDMVLGEKFDAASLGLQGKVLFKSDKDGKLKANKITEIRSRPE